MAPSLAGSWSCVQSAVPPPPIFVSSLPTLSSRWPALCSSNQREGPIVKMMSRDRPGKGGTERAPDGRAQSVCASPTPGGCWAGPSSPWLSDACGADHWLLVWSRNSLFMPGASALCYTHMCAHVVTSTSLTHPTQLNTSPQKPPPPSTRHTHGLHAGAHTLSWPGNQAGPGRPSQDLGRVSGCGSRKGGCLQTASSTFAGLVATTVTDRRQVFWRPFVWFQ